MAIVKNFVGGANFFAVILPKKNKLIRFEVAEGIIKLDIQQKYFVVNNGFNKKSFGSGTEIVPISKKLYTALLLRLRR